MNTRNSLLLPFFLLLAACATPVAQSTARPATATKAPSVAPLPTFTQPALASPTVPAPTATLVPTPAPQPTAPGKGEPVALQQKVSLSPQQGYETTLNGQAGQPAAFVLTPPEGATAPDFTLTAPDGSALFEGKGARFWMGLLPQSGEYRFAVMPSAAAVGVDIALYTPYRQPQTLQNQEIGYSLTYDALDFVPEMPGIFPNEISGLRLTAPLGRTLESAYLLVTLEPMTNWHQCVDTPPQTDVGTLESTPLGDRSINGEGYRGYDVVLPVFVDNTFFDRQFRAYNMQNNRCVTVHLLLHAERPGDQVSEHEKQAAWAHLERAFLSMVWTP